MCPPQVCLAPVARLVPRFSAPNIPVLFLLVVKMSSFKMADEEFPGREAVDLAPAVLDADEDNFVWPDYAPPPPPTPPPLPVPVFRTTDPNTLGRYLIWSSCVFCCFCVSVIAAGRGLSIFAHPIPFLHCAWLFLVTVAALMLSLLLLLLLAVLPNCDGWLVCLALLLCVHNLMWLFLRTPSLPSLPSLLSLPVAAVGMAGCHRHGRCRRSGRYRQRASTGTAPLVDSPWPALL